MQPQVEIDTSEFLLNLHQIQPDTIYVQSYTGVSVVCLYTGGAINGSNSFSIQTNNTGVYILNNLNNVIYKSNPFLPPNQTVEFSLAYSGTGTIWNLSSNVSKDVNVSPTLAWLNLFGTTLPTPPPKTSRLMASMGLAIYESLVAHPAMLDLAVVNEAGRITMAYYLPLVDTSALYNQFPKLTGLDLVTVTNFVTNLITVTLAYPALADNPVYAGPPPTTVAPYLWNGSNPILPNWSQSGYLGNGFAFVPTTTDPSTTMDADAAALLIVRANLTQAQIEIAKHFIVSPPAHLTQLACEMLSTLDQTERWFAQTMALVTVAISNAAMAAWTVKFDYWGARPFMFIPGLVSVIPTPNFPGYISGHSTFAGAWNIILSLQIPRFSVLSQFFANLASISRVYGLIHFQADCTDGLTNGRDSANSLYSTLLPAIKAYTTFL